ncbi:hypothetical protein IACHDJAJ_00090 [Aeromonas phage vB_AdhS_TS3]|nr:hypothetical protein IACHDJAJ_00090 [Aeromonas phage vB_AdhS_TS3]
MAKVTYLNDLITRQVSQILAMDREEIFFSGGGSSRRQQKVSGRGFKVANKLVNLEWVALVRKMQ